MVFVRLIVIPENILQLARRLVQDGKPEGNRERTGGGDREGGRIRSEGEGEHVTGALEVVPGRAAAIISPSPLLEKWSHFNLLPY